MTSETFEGQRRDDVEQRERKKDIKRQKVFREQNTAQAIEQINSMNDPETSIRLRNPMSLPVPTVRNDDCDFGRRADGGGACRYFSLNVFAIFCLC